MDGKELLLLKEHLQREGSLILPVRVHPRAKRTRVSSVLVDGTLKVDIAAAPEDGAANDALIVLIADLFSVPRSSVQIKAGASSRRKLLFITKP